MFSAMVDRFAARFPRAGRPLLWLRKHRKTRRTLIIALFHLVGALTSIHAILNVRTAQGAIAWAVSLNTVPYVAVPAYWIFGRSNFAGYIVLRRDAEHELKDEAQQLTRALLEMRPAPGSEPESAKLLERLAKLPVTRGNHIELLIDGEATFRSIFESIAQARDYVLVEFYIIHDDALGRRLKEALIAKARSGVRCYVLYDEVGSHDLPVTYTEELRRAGVEIHPFNTRKGDTNRFQLNFRNHRKIVIVDGHTAFIGGHNVGDEYLGKDPKYGPWRDTHVKAQGPVVQCVQIAWAEDWNWAAGSRLKLNWKPAPAPGGEGGLAFCLPSGPADEFETCTFFFLHAINTAKKRIWIASPFFVPDEQILSALQLAAPRGVDVRILLSANPDQLHIYLSSFTFLPQLEKAGVQTWRYNEGYLHQKAILVDDVCGIGTANFDNRSFRLNFEITLLFTETSVVADAEKMFTADFARSNRATAADFTARPWWFRFAARTSRLMAPIQ
ncbi:MAG: cardiolipin synthase [Verrucomicrobiaceae bacterium]|nr:MAG: cardiolipin synthase [Verrucomicrobiaceae bacterium]